MNMSFPASRQIGLIITGLLTLASLSHAQLNIPGADGSDGPLVITNNTVIDLRQAGTAAWDANNAANAGKGIYDSNKWAVVFKYSSVTIASGATVTFANHGSRAPVVWLVSGDVTINGTVNLNGQNARNAPFLPEPGPGGFRGGTAYFTLGVGQSAGFGPGGAPFIPDDYGRGGSYGSLGRNGAGIYGNPSLLPLIGGSGGSGDGKTTLPHGGGGAGGGAILIACSQTINVVGTVVSSGGNGYNGNPYTCGGSGGGIRLIATTIAGNGAVVSAGGGGWNAGGLGRIRIEYVTNNANPQVTPDPSVVTLQPASTPLIWLPSDGPTARIVSIGAVSAPADPRASFGTFGADVTLPQVATTPVIVETTIAESASTVRVRVTPRANGNYTETTATLVQTNSTSPLVLRWLANVPVSIGYSAVQVRVVRP